MNSKEAKVVLALAESGMNPTRASKIIYFHRNTIRYHMGKIKKKTGLDPSNFYDLVELVKMAKCGEGNGG